MKNLLLQVYSQRPKGYPDHYYICLNGNRNLSLYKKTKKHEKENLWKRFGLNDICEKYAM